MLTSVVDKTRQVLRFTRTVFITKENLDGPIRTKRNCLYPEDSAWNRAVLYLRHSLAQRTQFRLDFYVLARSGARTVYKRLRKQSVFVNVGDPHQAEMAIEAILSFAQSLDGKWLAPSESTQVVDSSLPISSQGNSQAIRSESAGDSSVTPEVEQSEETSGLENQPFSGS
jgi:hypothetical protein